MLRRLFPWLYEPEPNLHNWTAWPALRLPAGRGAAYG
jgi:hypothetical protein